MKNRTMSAAFVFGTFYFAMLGAASAQDALSSCNPATGLTPSGAQCVTLTPVDPTRYQTQIDGEGASNYRPVDVNQLAETYDCRQEDSRYNPGAGGAILIEDCGQPIIPDPSTYKEFVGYAGNAVPAPPAPTYVAPPPPAPAYVAPPPPPPVYVAPPAAPAVYAAPAFASTGLSSAGLVAAGLGAAALVGIAAFALDNNDSTTATSTTN